MTELPWRSRALINLSALKQNVITVRKTISGAKVIAIVKADAYGHGLATVSKFLAQEVDAFAVATMEEGIQCRQYQNDKPILVLSEFWQQSQLVMFDKYQLQPVVHSLQQANWLVEYRGAPLQCWIKFDSGMNRLGLNHSQLLRAYELMRFSPSVKAIRIMSHLANAENKMDSYSEIQIQRFIQATSDLPCELSMSNSAGVMLWRQGHFQWVRPGLMLYGVSPYDQAGQDHYKLQPVMHLQARLLAIKEVAKGQPVGYGGSYITPKKCQIAMVGLGYGDGYPRQIDDNAYVLIRDKPARIIGKISMDMITIDVTEFEDIVIGDEVTLWGNGLGVDQVAQWANTIPYELLCKVTARIPRQAVFDN